MTATQKIVVLSPYDPRDVSRWSGTTSFLYSALKKRRGDVDFVSGEPIDFAARVTNKLLHGLGIRLDIRFSKPFSWIIGKLADHRLRKKGADIIIVIAGSNYIPFLNTTKPIVYISDATFAAVERLYPEFANLPVWLRRHGNELERRSLARANHFICSSEWTKQSAIADYGVDENNIDVIPFGPNITPELIGEFYRPKKSDFSCIKLLFASADWERKNGELVLQIAEVLKNHGFACEVILVGHTPERINGLKGVRVVRFLDKTNSKDLTELCKLYEEAHFFILPTSAETFGVVFSEAQAFGCPSLTYDVGGTSSAVLDGVTGIVLPLTAKAEDFVLGSVPR
jgi:glycosyltransferase involved in cell wall biosynthesis